MLTDAQKEKIFNVISERVHGIEFYDKSKSQEFLTKIEGIFNQLDLGNSKLTDQEKIDRVNDYLKKNVEVRKDYFLAFNEIIPEIPKDELKYRTAYAAFFEGQAMCAGFTEASRILLELAGLETKTLLSILPGHDKQLLHYVTAIKYDRGSGRDYYIMDPEREGSCERKGYDFRRYLMSMRYILPDEYFFEHKVGPAGVGPKASDYLLIANPHVVMGKNNVDELFKIDNGVTHE